MTRTAPQENTFKIVLNVQLVCDIILWIVFTSSIAAAIVNNYYEAEGKSVLTVMDTINIVLLIMSFTLNSIKDFYLFPRAESKRRFDFIDNSLDSKFSLDSSNKYYTNNELKPGVHKMGVNLFQNLVFTTVITKKMRLAAIVKTSIFASIFILIAIYGFKNSPIALPILQLFFSAYILGDLIKLLLFHHRNEVVLDHVKSIFATNNFEETNVLKNWVQYETNLSWAMIVLSDKTFKKHNAAQEEKWQEIKIKYNINKWQV